MKKWDVIIVGAGIIGLSLAIELRKRGAQVLVVERGEPGREASHAAAGIIADCGDETPALLQPLATASARMDPEFVRELHDASGINPDLREQGTLSLLPPQNLPAAAKPVPLDEFEPALSNCHYVAVYLKERSVDPRTLTAAALKAAKHRGVDLSSGTLVREVIVSAGAVAEVATDKTSYSAPIVVNCAGAWSGLFLPLHLPTRPVRGQMLAVATTRLLQHVIRAPEVYLVPRSDGRVLIGSTLEEAGYDKRTDPNTIQRMHEAAISLIPALEQARILEDWAGLRPGTPDDLPILGATTIPGYFVAAGHYRDGIMLAPITARVMAQVITGEKCDWDLSAFSPSRFTKQ